MATTFPTFYDYITQTLQSIREYYEGFGNMILKTLQAVIPTLTGGATNLIVSPITSAIQGLFNWIWTSFANALNSAFQSIINFIWNNIVNPIKMMIQVILNRIYERFEGLLFIVLTVPPMIYEIRKFVDTPKLESIPLILLKPFLGYLGAKMISTVTSPYLRPVTIPISPPPEAPKLPLPTEITVDVYDMIPLGDEVSIGLAGITEVEDTLPLSDEVEVELLGFPEWEVTDTLPLSDSVEVSTEYITLGAEVTDTLGISDSVETSLLPESTIEYLLSDTLPLSDSVEITIIQPVDIADTIPIDDSVEVELLPKE